ncbi:MAG: ribulose-phosphate 3-epimerase, partial [Eubacteriales bacterium]
AGVALDPGTPVEIIYPYLHAVDAVLLVSVCVGFGGQEYIGAVDEKIRKLAEKRSKAGLDFEIGLDGGINLHNAREKIDLGADTLVAGSMFFGCPDPKEIVKKILL